MDALTDFILHPSGAIAELYGLSDDMIRKYAHQTIRDNDICILYVDNARLIHDHELDGISGLHTSLFDYADLIELLTIVDGADIPLVIIDNFYNVQNRPKRMGYFFNAVQTQALKHQYNVLFFNQMMNNFKYPELSHVPYIPLYGSNFAKYASLRIEVIKTSYDTFKPVIRSNRGHYGESRQSWLSNII